MDEADETCDAASTATTGKDKVKPKSSSATGIITKLENYDWAIKKEEPTATKKDDSAKKDKAWVRADTGRNGCGKMDEIKSLPLA